MSELDKTASPATCPDCGREKAVSAADAARGLCPKWWAVRDADAEKDCRTHAGHAGAAMSARAGEVWKTNSRKGPLTVRFLSDVDTTIDEFVKAEILDGRARYMSSDALRLLQERRVKHAAALVELWLSGPLHPRNLRFA